MHHAVARDQRAVTDLDPAGKQRAARDNRAIADPTIVRRVRVLHEKVITADSCVIAARASAMDRDALAKNIAVADYDAAPLAAISQVLRVVANHSVRMDHVLGANFGVAQNRDVADQTCPRANPDPSVEEAEGP